ncbi:MAG: hypothetical protein MI806_21725 [Minwuiales bacterium]|nr:hypothetical protein [Minwuiales bacterium]
MALRTDRGAAIRLVFLAAALVAAPAAAAGDKAFMEGLFLDAPETALRLCRNMPLIGLQCVGIDKVGKRDGTLTYTHHLAGPVTRSLRPGGGDAPPADYRGEAGDDVVAFAYQPPARAVKRYRQFLRVTLARERVYRRDRDGRLRLSSERSIDWFQPLSAEQSMRDLASAARRAGQPAFADAILALGLDE